MLGQSLRRELSRRGEDGERDRQVEPRSLLAQGGGSKVDSDTAIERPLEGCRHDAAPDPVLRFLARSIDQTDDREAGDAPLEVCLDLDLPRLEAHERMSDRACKHASD